MSSKRATILGIESSCDDCSAAIVDVDFESANWARVRGLSTFSQVQIHNPYGGVVPEIASRSHLEEIHQEVWNALSAAELLGPGVSLLQAMERVDAIAVTNRPGLVGSLLVGVTVAKTIAYLFKKPLVGVHHIEGHLMSPYLDQETVSSKIFPQILLMVSGGHTQLHWIERPPLEWPEDFLVSSRLGRSLDDAAGEAFDKTAKLLGFPYPGGKFLEEASVGGNPHAFALPRSKPKNDLDFSFSGFKTAANLLIQAQTKNATLEKNRADLAASIQEAIIEALVDRLEIAVERHSPKSLCIVGGVAANKSLRAKIQSRWSLPLLVPTTKYCTDNAAMIALAGGNRFCQGKRLSFEESLSLSAIPYPEI